MCIGGNIHNYVYVQSINYHNACMNMQISLSSYICSDIHSYIFSMNSVVRLIIYPPLLLSLLHSTTGTVYTVIPDRHYNPNTTCHHCHNLQHYLLNITKYFTSNTQLHFLPGLYLLDHTKLIIQNVYNISLIGCPGNSTARIQEVLINSESNSLLILMLNISRLTIKNIKFSATNSQGLYKCDPLLTIKDCSSVILEHLVIFKLRSRECAIFVLAGINIMGNSNFSHVKIFDKMQLFYNKMHTDKEHHNLLMSNCEITSISLNMSQDSYKVTLKIIHTQLHLHCS